MNILSAEKISKSYSEKVLIDEISLGIGEGEKIALIGINGTGKSTLLKMIAGIENPDSGRIIKANSARIDYLPQNPEFDDGATILQQIFKGNSPVMQLLREYEETLFKFNEVGSQYEKKLVALSQRMDEQDAWTLEKEVKSILTKLGISNFDLNVSTLSGGQRKRVAMAGALINPTDLLILDEPTNHIDNDTVDWLEKYLNKRKGALLMVTHDRYFLERVANRIIELDKGKLYSYQANYSKFLEMKAEREELEQASERKRESLLRRELEWIRRGAQARSTKQKARIDRFEKLQEESVNTVSDKIEIGVPSSRLGRKLIELENISKGFQGTDLIKDFSYLFLREDRIGIIGSNGSGKSTLLNIISGRLSADKGKVVKGETIKIGYFSQENDTMDENLRVIDYIREEAEFLTTHDGVVTASQMLERFLFPPNVQWTPIAKLSGGERRRLYLLRVLMGAPNVLLMDEPSNDLDIQTLSILENYIEEFPGIVVTVSHDRYFLDKVATRLFAFEGDGVIKQYEGNYSDYRACIEQEADKQSVNKPKDKYSKETETKEDKNKKPLKFTFKEQKEFDEIDNVIYGLEEQLKEVKINIDKSASDFQRLEELISLQGALEIKLDEALERWTYLNELAEEISRNKSDK